MFWLTFEMSLCFWFANYLLFTYSNLITHTHSHSPLPPPHTQRVTQIAVVLLIVIGLFMFTYHSTTFDLEGFILVRMSPSHWLEGEVDCVHHVHHTRGGRRTVYVMYTTREGGGWGRRTVYVMYTTREGGEEG